MGGRIVRGPYGQLLLVFKCLCMSSMAGGSKTIKRKKTAAMDGVENGRDP
jgi:hypothetical protein